MVESIRLGQTVSRSYYDFSPSRCHPTEPDDCIAVYGTLDDVHRIEPDGRQVPVPGVFARMSETPMAVRRWAPRLGEHNDEIAISGGNSALPILRPGES